MSRYKKLALAERPEAMPTLVSALHMPARDWIARHRIIEQLLEEDVAEGPIDPAFLQFHAPRIYDGLVGRKGIINHPMRRSFETSIPRCDELGEDVESGLMRRNDDEEKWQFHFHKDIESWLRGQGAPVADFRAFFDSCATLDNAAYDLSAGVGRMFDLVHNGRSSLEKEIREGLRITRILDYLPNRANPAAPDAKVHYDRSTVTVHWESTEPGLVVYDRQGRLRRMNETNRGTVLIFWGRKLGLRYEHLCGRIGTVHGVRDTERTLRNGTNRRAIVSFVHGTLNAQAVARYRNDVARAERGMPRRYKIDAVQAARYPI